MKKRIAIAAISLSMLITLNSCGVMFGGSRYEGTITAKNHPNAEIIVNGEKAGKGSVTGLYPRNKPLVVEIKEEGCASKTQTFDKTFRAGNFILSAISWGLIGIGVDLGTGASYKPDHVNNKSIEKVSDKKFNFNVDYSDCKTK
jgi:hypothetical protein